jgi:transaldolase
MKKLNDLRVRIFADGADYDGMVEMAANPLIKGFTTNPTLMKKAGVTDYEAFARRVLEKIPHHPISFEVFADDFFTMVQQARRIAGWGANVNVKIPVSDTKGRFTGEVIRQLSQDGIVLNVTAVMTLNQVRAIVDALPPQAEAIVSVFAGRIADTGVDPVPHMIACRDILAARPNAVLLWASPRELLNIFQADDAGCGIITVTNDMLAKLSLIGKDLLEYSRETVQMFHRDALSAAFDLKTESAAA